MPDAPDRKTVKVALRGAGLSSRQVDAFLRGGWRALVGDVQAESDELRDRLARLEQLVTVESFSSEA